MECDYCSEQAIFTLNQTAPVMNDVRTFAVRDVNTVYACSSHLITGVHWFMKKPRYGPICACYIQRIAE